LQTNPPKVIWIECIATPHGRNWTCPLHVLLAVQYPLQMNPITQPRVCYINTAMPHVSYTVLAVLSPPPQKKKFAPSQTGDIHAQSSQWNDG